MFDTEDTEGQSELPTWAVSEENRWKFPENNNKDYEGVVAETELTVASLTRIFQVEEVYNK